MNASRARAHARRFASSPFFRVGVPMLTLSVASLYGMTEFVRGKKQLESVKAGKRTLTPREFDLEEEHRRVMDKLGAHEYDNVRIARPGEEGAAAGAAAGAGASPSPSPSPGTKPAKRGA